MDKATLLTTLASHTGRANGISGSALAQRMGLPSRRVRKLVTEARRDGALILGTPKTGYYMATNAAEFNEFVHFIHSRAMHSLYTLSLLRKVSLPTLLGQISLELESQTL